MQADPYQVCKLTVDGTDFWIYEPTPFDPKWFSHKINGPAVRYEVAVCIKTGWIVWVNGPFPAGEWPDLNIARLSLIHFLDDGEYYIADGGYADGNQYSSTPNGLNDYEQRTKALARARHETVNRRFKIFGCLSQRYRHDLGLHGMIFHAVANIVQLTILCGHPLFEIEYNEADFLPPPPAV
jgi:DDE superfamily endonuclease